MNNKISFEGIGEVVATFHADESVKAGMPVKLDSTGKMMACGDGERFAGVAVTDTRDGCAAVRVAGFQLASTADESVTCGYVNLVADSTGGVKKSAGSEGGEYLVTAVENGTAAFLM